MKIALAQINPTVGDIAGNEAMIARCIDDAAAQDARLVIFPELAIIGYPPKDLLLKPTVIDECREAVDRLAARCTKIAALIGLPAAANGQRGRSLHNAAAFCRDGKVERIHRKSLLPTYDVFDELRYFEPGPPVELAELDGVKLGVSICEDLWNEDEVFDRPLYHARPIDTLAEAGAQVLINASASPFVAEKHDFRHRLFAHVSKKHGLPLIYCNQVGGNDELIFDGNSCVFDGQGQLLAQARDFEEDLLLVDLAEKGSSAAKVSTNRIEAERTGSAAIYHALVLGLRDYCRKCGFKSIVLGLSGGIDSALSCAIAVAAVGSENVHGVTMPSRYSSQGSVDDARLLAENLNMRFDSVAIDPAHAAFEGMLAPFFEGTQADTTEENLQARIRGVIMMALSNKFRSLLVTTGNKSELAVGYCTLYGDMAGGLAVLSDLPKTRVYEVSRWINESPDSPLLKQFGKPVIPSDTITKPPSAELRPDQKDQDSLPEYELLDAIIERYVEAHESAAQIIAATGADEAVVRKMVRLIDLNEYKRKQAAPGLKVTARAFGFGRRMPIAQRYQH